LFPEKRRVPASDPPAFLQAYRKREPRPKHPPGCITDLLTDPYTREDLILPLRKERHMSETDNATLAVAQVFKVADSEWLDHLVDLLRDADMESFRTKLLAEYKRRRDAFSDRRELYHSPNGDSWFLSREPVNGHAFVIYQPNAPSGGLLSNIEVGNFLREGAGPEQQALLRLMGTLAEVPPHTDRA
jgi:hypothetical protein